MEKGEWVLRYQLIDTRGWRSSTQAPAARLAASVGISQGAAHKADEWTTGIHKGFNYNSRQRWLKDDNDDMEQ